MKLTIERIQRAYLHKHSERDIIRYLVIEDSLNFALNSKVEGAFLEFGVYTGSSLIYISSYLNNQKRIFGFDSFKGLPEDWIPGWEKGHFDLNGKRPTLPDPIILYPGWFIDTIPAWKNDYQDKIQFLHIDSDLYSSAKTILELLEDRIVSGTVILFDEFYNYTGYQEGEFKAFNEYLERSGREVNILVRGLMQVCFEIL